MHTDALDLYSVSGGVVLKIHFAAEGNSNGSILLLTPVVVQNAANDNYIYIVSDFERTT